MPDTPYSASDFIGRGIAFPMRIDQSGSFAMTKGVTDLEESILMVLTTAPGERLMRPLFGCRIWELLFEPINANTLGLMREAVTEAIGRWEPRVEVDEVLLEAGTSDTGEVRINIRYTVRTTNDKRNLVYPFYVIPQEDES